MLAMLVNFSSGSGSTNPLWESIHSRDILKRTTSEDWGRRWTKLEAS